MRRVSIPASVPAQLDLSTGEAAPVRTPGLYVGTSGWAYPTWKPEFYPPKLPAKQFLTYYAQHLTSVEVNYTFRSLPTEAMLDGWLQATAGPAGEAPFRLSFKAPEIITHRRRLRDCDEALSRFLDALAPVAQAGRLGLLLFQLPPNFKADSARLEGFLALPSLAAAKGLRLAFEFRHESWFAEETYAVLRAHDVALCVAEGEELVTPEVHTALGFVCFRKRRSGAYPAAELREFARHCVSLGENGTREVYVYFRHEDAPTGAQNALATLAAAAESHTS